MLTVENIEHLEKEKKKIKVTLGSSPISLMFLMCF